VSKRYRVAGSQAVFGHKPGEIFDRDIPDAQERRLLASGALKESRAQEPDAVDSSKSSNPKE
jgi:hypothetical protein